MARNTGHAPTDTWSEQDRIEADARSDQDQPGAAAALPAADAEDKYDDNPEPDPATLDDDNFDMLDMPPGSHMVIPLPRTQDGEINLLGCDVEVMEETTDYGDLVKCRVQGDPKDVSRLAMRSRNYFAKAWNQHLHASGDVTNQ